MKYIFKTVTFFICINILTYSCTGGQINKEETKKILDSGDQNRIMEAVYLIGEKQDISFTEELFRLSYNQQISHQRDFLGMSIHQACMVAFKKITHQPPPNKISYRVDTTNIVFYRDLLKK